MITVTDKSNCCGCTACFSICPKKCIKMVPDEEGFLYPDVKTVSCVNCGLCEKVCPVLHKPTSMQEKKTAYIVRHKNAETLQNSSSGGFFTALCEYVIMKNGVVCGAVFDDDWTVKHCFAETLEQCKAFRGSKYVQSNITGIFSQIKKYLLENRYVCFSGTPCQVEGLRNYLNKDYENLILVDFVCHGVPSALLWKEYLQSKDVENIERISFRDKRCGYQLSGLGIDYTNGRTYFATARVDTMLKIFFSHIALRWSCYVCRFKGLGRCSDFTMYDAWHTEKILDITDDDKGYTNVIARGKKAESIVDEIKGFLNFYPVPLEKIIPVNGGMLMHSAKKAKNRDSFYNSIKETGLQKSVKKYLPLKPGDRMIEKIKVYSSKIGIAPMLSRFRKTIRKKYPKGW